MLGYDDDDGDDFGLPSLSNMRRRSKRMATKQNSVNALANATVNSSMNAEPLPPAVDSEFSQASRWHSDSADIAVERPSLSYPMPKKSEGKILRPQYKDILQGKRAMAFSREFTIIIISFIFIFYFWLRSPHIMSCSFYKQAYPSSQTSDRPRQCLASDKLSIDPGRSHKQRSRRHKLSNHAHQQVQETPSSLFHFTLRAPHTSLVRCPWRSPRHDMATPPELSADQQRTQDSDARAQAQRIYGRRAAGF